jgi:DNA-binding transcriptional LysR family regulator
LAWSPFSVFLHSLHREFACPVLAHVNGAPKSLRGAIDFRGSQPEGSIKGSITNAQSYGRDEIADILAEARVVRQALLQAEPGDDSQARHELAVAPERSDPATAEEHYRVAATDYALLLFLHQVAREVNKLSPHSALRIETPADSVFDDVAHGRLDLTFYVADPPGALRQELLFDDVCVCVMSADHPLAKRKRLTLDEYVRCSHLVIDIIDGEQPLIADRLRELGVARRAALTVPQNAGVSAALPGTNLVATLHKRLVDRFADDPALAVVAAPVELEPFQYFMVWQPRLDHDPAQQWLRETIRSVATATVGGAPARR